MSSTRPDLKFSDAGDERSFYARYNQLSPADESTVRVVDHKDYFTVLDRDADLIADAIYKTQAVIKYNKGARYVTVSAPVFLNNVLKFCLIDNSMKMEIYNKKFEIVATASPGNLESVWTQYGVSLESNDGSVPVVGAIKVGANRKIGICVVDLSSSAITVSQVDDSDTFGNVESLLIQLGVKEIVAPSNYDPQNDPDIARLFRVIDKLGNVVVSTVRASAFSTSDLEQDLSKLVCKDDQNVEMVLAAKTINSGDFSVALSCLGALVTYLDLLGENAKHYSIERFDLSQYMKLDSSTLGALNIFPSKSAPGRSTTTSSMYELLNKCSTAAGSRLLSQWLKQPLTNLSKIEDRHNLVQKLLDDTTLRVTLSQDLLSQVPDIKGLIKKVHSGIHKLGANENKKLDNVVRLYQLVLILPNFLDSLRAKSEADQLIGQYWLDPIDDAYQKLVKFQELIETTIDLSPLESSSASELLNTDFNIKPEFDETLVDINNNLQDTLAKIKQQHELTADDLNIELDKKLKLENHQIHGWCFRVTRNDSTVLRNTDYVELQTVKAGVFFTSKNLRALSAKYADISKEYNDKQKELIKEILTICITYDSVFAELSLTLAHLDVIASFATVSILSPVEFVKPSLTPLSPEKGDDVFKQRQISLANSRHPILEVQEDLNFIPNDVKLSNGEKSFAIITGPNMGGKSTYIRQVGVIALMSQIGCFIPADSPATLPVFDSILSRVGAGDSQLKGLSTFMIEMLETSSILANATHNSLIIIDELGRGTSTYDGFGLAYAIAEHLIKEKQCFTLFATHFHELTELSNQYSQVENLQVKALIENDDDLTLIYKVEPGVSSKSFGINVAELVKFPQKIINMAKRKASELQEDHEDEYIQIKKTKCTSEEIDKGVEILNKILKDWKQQCYDVAEDKLMFSASETAERLKKIVDSSLGREDKFVQEIVTLL